MTRYMEEMVMTELSGGANSSYDYQTGDDVIYGGDGNDDQFEIKFNVVWRMRR